MSLLAYTQSVCHFWLDPKVTKRSRLTLTGYFETYARCRIPTRFAQTGMLRALATVSSLDARPLRPSEGKRSFPLILTVISLFIIHYSLLIINYHEKVRMEYYYQSDHRRSYRHRGSTWHPILYSLIFNFNYQFSIIMGKAYCFYQNYREVRLLVIHCSATRYDRDFPVEALRSSHKARGFADIGYHFYITRDGELHRCRPVNQIGAHAAGWNDKSIGICYEGGLDEQGRPADTRTYAQRCTLTDLLRQLRRDYPEARILGHYQLSPYIRKACPCFDAREEYLVL